MRKSGTQYGVVMLEMASIVVGVVLGFAASNWDASRKDAQRAEAALSRMVLELEVNLEAVSGVVPYYDSILRGMGTEIRSQGDRDLPTLSTPPVPGWRGITPPALRTSAFAVASNTGVLEYLPFETADQLTTAYGSVEDLATAIDQVTAAYLSNGITMRLSGLMLLMGSLHERSTMTGERIRVTLEDLRVAGT